jgi:LytS/YehU family sensor histidine kinase
MNFTQMNRKNTKQYFILLQVLLWVIYFLVMLAYGGNKWKSYYYSFAVNATSTFFYIAIIYSNSLWLLPALYKKGKKKLYVYAVVAMLAALIVLRLWVENLVLLPIQKVFYDFNPSHIFLGVITCFIAFLFSILLYVAKSYIGLLKKQEEMKTRQLATELDLLKQQVQPHFLFNTLNNIYSLAHAKSNNTTIAIEKLAGSMRYFMEDAPKEKVPLQTEINFINNYISLEQMRMLYPVTIKSNFTNEKIALPPMLLMPFIENLFKHGVDKTKKDNEAIINLVVNNNKLLYTVKNKLQPEITNGNGIGLTNLKKRLYLLYGDGYTLSAKTNHHYFEAILEIPV